VGNYLEYKNGFFYWNPLFIIEVHDWELESMIQDIYATKIRSREVNKLELIHLKAKGFQVKSYYNKVLRGAGNYFPWQCIWKFVW
jgi:hypothetical protein